MRRHALVVSALAVAGLLAGCVSAPAAVETAATDASAPASSASSSPQPSTSASATPVTCDDATTSYAPATSSAYANAIKARGYLLVGVSADTRLLGAVNPNNPDQFQGFDIDMANLVAKAIFGDGYAQHIRFKVITTDTRIPQLQTAVDNGNNAAGGVDLVARAFTMNCQRWTQIAFSAVYLNASQKVLVPKDSGIKQVSELAGKTVCAAQGSTSLTYISQAVPGVKTKGLLRHTDCLVALQAGEVDAITGDDAILAGFSDQDPNTVVFPQGTADGFHPEPYGLGVSADHKDFAAYVNHVLDQARSDGAWQASYDKWLKPALGVRTPPKPLYGRK